VPFGALSTLRVLFNALCFSSGAHYATPEKAVNYFFKIIRIFLWWTEFCRILWWCCWQMLLCYQVLDRCIRVWESLRNVTVFGICVKYLLPFLVAMAVSGCSGDMTDVSDRDLRQKQYHCQMSTNLSAAEIQVCANIRRECEKRAQAGHYAC
jgi:hypothetical protein